MMNGKNKMTKPRPCKPRIIRTENNETHELGNPILFTELGDAIETLKNEKAAGLDNMFSEQIKHFERTSRC